MERATDMSDPTHPRTAARGLPWSLAGLLALAVVGASGGCSGTPDVPPLNPNPTNQVLPGKAVWHDLLTPDVDGAKRFYGELFGWTFQDVVRDGVDYALVLNGTRVIGGILRPEEPIGRAAEWVTFFSVADVDAAVANAAASGGDVTIEPVDLERRGRLAVIDDPEGAAFGVLRSPTGDPVDADPAVDEWIWQELWSNDLAAAGRFYGSVLGFQREEISRPLGTYSMFTRDGVQRAGGIRIPQTDIQPTWVPAVRVADVQAAVRKARELGGTIVLEPRSEIRDGTVAIVADPRGAPVTIMEWEGDR
jgi:predicted enzyme related to lactoylglutathione lyase